jgi:phosphate:Na+ symporter
MTWLLTPANWLRRRLSGGREAAAPPTPHFRYDQAEGPEAALDLLRREQARLAALLPQYLDEVREDTRGSTVTCAALHESTGAALREMQGFTTRLVERSGGGRPAAPLERLRRRTDLLLSIGDSVRELTAVIGQAGTSGALYGLIAGITEGLHLVLLTAAEAVEHPTAPNRDVLHELTADRGGLMERIRQALLRGEQSLSLEDHQTLFTSTSLFERTIRLLRALAAALDEVAPGPMRQG